MLKQISARKLRAENPHRPQKADTFFAKSEEVSSAANQKKSKLSGKGHIAPRSSEIN